LMISLSLADDAITAGSGGLGRRIVLSG
jgi:hypothetical protein